jgi:hypothetical protein
MIVSAASVALVLMATPKEAAAITYTFYGITNNDPTGAAIAAGEAQLSVGVTDAGNGQILFTFFNSGPAASSIADIYFDDSSLLSSFQIINGSGVSFSPDANPSNLPGGNTTSPAFAATFSADSDAPAQSMGVNPGESVGILFDLQPGSTFADAIAALNNGDLRVGLHVQDFAGGYSEGFINGPPIALSLPDTLILFGTGSLVAVVAALRRRRRKQ